MTQIIYATDTYKQSTDFINILLSDLQKLGVKNIEHDRRYNLIAVGDKEVRGICIYESCICCGMRNVKYFIDGIDMRNYNNAGKRQFDNLIYHIREIMSHFRKDTKQLSGKDELIKILTEGQLMCEFCKNIGIGIPNYTFCDEELPTYKNSSGEFIELRKIVNKIALVFSNSADEYRYGALNINYCPMCGQKLTEMEE